MRNKSRPTIAFLTNYFSKNLINHALWEGVYSTVKDEDVNLFCFPWNPNGDPGGFKARAEGLFNLISRETIDGLVVWGGGLWGNISFDDMKKFFHQLCDFPLVSIGPAVEGIPSIIIDNYKGMYDACVHLIEQHSCQRLVFLRGPLSNTEAEERFAAYKDAREKYNLPQDPGLILQGDLSRNFGVKASKILLDEQQTEFDAIVAANDYSALGAFWEIEGRGIKIPEDIKIVGFDDIEESQYNRSPLTTVRQPFEEMGVLAVKNILSLLQGKSIPDISTIPARLIVRQSCGCLGASAVKAPEDVLDIVLKTEQEYTALQKDKILSTILKEMDVSSHDQELDTGLIGDLIDGVIKELVHNEHETFINRLGRRLLFLKTRNEIVMLNTLLSLLRRIVLSYICRDVKLVIKAENLWQQARIMIGECEQRIISFESIKKEYEYEVIQQIYRRMIVTFKIDEFMNIVALNFPRLGIKSCFIALYEHPSVSIDKARLKLAYRENTCIDVRRKEFLFPSHILVPDELLPRDDRFAFIIELLYFENEQLGFIVFGEDFLISSVYEVLRTQLGGAIKGAHLIQDKEKLLKNLENHTHHLQVTMEKLKNSNEELEQFFFIVSHDLKEPLRKILIFSNRLKEQYKKIEDTKTLDYAKRLGNAVDRMQTLIDNLLDYYRLTTKAKPFCSVNLSQVLGDVINDLEMLIENKKADITLCDLPVIDAEPHQMQHLFQNLLSNALKFHKPGEAPVINIRNKIFKKNKKEYCEIIIEDNGIGIEEKYYKSIFGVFLRLHSRNEYEGTGIGLAICKKIVDKHNGTIRVQSEFGKGSQFFITLPVKQANGS